MRTKNYIFLVLFGLFSFMGKASDVVIYPNPVSNELTLEVKGDAVIESAAIFNYLGAEVMSFNCLNCLSSSIDVGHLQTGRYFVKVIYANGAVEVLTIIKK